MSTEAKTAEISVSVEELIPTAQYANVKVGPFIITRTVPDDENLQQAVEETYDIADKSLQKKRDEVIKSLSADSI